MCTVVRSTISEQDTVSSGAAGRASSIAENDTGSFSDLRQCLESAGIPKDTASIILSSCRGNTQKQYGTYLKKWSKFCNRTEIDKLKPSITDVLKFLTQLHESGLRYSAMKTAKSAISSFLSIANPSSVHLGSHILIERFMKGVFEIKPSLHRYNCTWSTEGVLRYLKSLSPLDDLSLLQLTRKLVTLFALTTGQRAQTLYV